MALKDTFKTLRSLLGQITTDLEKAENGNKAASQRVRTGSVKLEKLAKVYRKESIVSEKKPKAAKKAPKKAEKAKVAAKPAPKAAKKPAPKAAKASATPRALSFRKPTAKLPSKRMGAR